MDYDIFISYRRDGGSYYARILKAELEKRGYAGRVFLDYDGLKDGRFDHRIMQAIDDAKIFIFILSPGALNRCKDEGDWVRKEIIYALEHERHIIPVNFDNLFDGFPPFIPQQIREALGQHQFSKIDSESLLEASMDKLIGERIAPVVAPRSFGNTTAGTNAEIVIMSDADCDIRIFGKPVCTVLADVTKTLHLKKGNYLLEFISTECNQISEKQRYSVPDNDYVDFLEIKLKEKIQAIVNRKLICAQNQEGKWGYLDEHGEIIIPFAFLDAFEFREGLAPVEIETGCGLIDKTGKIVIPCKFKSAYSFHEGLALVKTETGYGFIDKTGKIVIPCKFEIAYSFHEGLASVKTETGYGFIDKTGEPILPCKLKSIFTKFCGDITPVKTETGYGFIDKKGRIVIPCKFQRAENFSENLASVFEYTERRGYGFIDKTGEIIIPCKFKRAEDFREGLALVNTEFGGGYGFIDKTGKIVIPCKFEIAYSFHEGLALVETETGYGFIDKTGKIVIPCKFEYAYSFRDGLAKVQTETGRGVINKSGEIVVPCIYKDIRL